MLTVGTPDANGEPADSIGRVTFRTVVDNPATRTDEALQAALQLFTR